MDKGIERGASFLDAAAATRLPVKTETSLEEEIQNNAISQQDSNQTLPAVNQPGDIRNGKAYAAMHRGKLLFVKPMARWFRWNETRWEKWLRKSEQRYQWKLRA